jgi:hypothetical protein
MRYKRIFSPVVAFSDRVKSCWSDNIETIDGCIPLHSELKQLGISALSIKTKSEKEYFVFLLPINKDWTCEDMSSWKNTVLEFDIMTSTKFTLNIELRDKADNNLFKTEKDIIEDDDWTNIKIPIDIKSDNIHSIVFTGPNVAEYFVIKSIILKETNDDVDV